MIPDFGVDGTWGCLIFVIAVPIALFLIYMGA